eukprot:CAMPEP_0175875642 /NCGR_PEP_ID=MMETSP0107_2-20121207/39573_1 /TAXON_ID=195067 ORGANISM="Goniomonas pacifica, Strain CCMP1869" /NCGR_SAMPLE_ID=MMETSP0107_2 /ASSEMBLY_ACC=CAM_ASM_000203 /LENGTH=56 /DNA_ID=CAMNT_0017194693 /DNA_START=37 /DNA_END=203 /DNA_ORIENTATION=+
MNLVIAVFLEYFSKAHSAGLNHFREELEEKLAVAGIETEDEDQHSPINGDEGVMKT